MRLEKDPSTKGKWDETSTLYKKLSKTKDPYEESDNKRYREPYREGEKNG